MTNKIMEELTGAKVVMHLSRLCRVVLPGQD